MEPDRVDSCPARLSEIVEAVVLGVRSVLAGVWLFLALVVLIPLAALARLLGFGLRVYDWCARFWAHGILWIMGMRVVCRGTEHIERGEHYIVAANHQGMLDIPALLVALPPYMPLRFVAKRSMFLIPILGWGMYLFGHVGIDRRGPREAMPGLLRAQHDVRRRWSVVFFPEGTRTYTGAMGPFKKGAFHTAARAGVRVLPVTIIGSWEKLPRQRLFALSRGIIEVVVHPPQAVPGEAPDQVQDAAEACRRQIAALATVPLSSSPDGGVVRVVQSRVVHG
jgi:1-acyl-sn-glycerol-3-phosphate acyltransferase